MIPSPLRTTARVLTAGLFLLLVGAGGAGFADTPGGWEDSPKEPLLAYLLVLFLIPAGLFVLITALTMLPSLVRRSGTGSAIQPRSED